MVKRHKPVRRGLSWIYAIGVHVAVAALLFLGFKWGAMPGSSGQTPHAPKKQIVQATVVSGAEVNKQLEQIKAAEAAKKRRQEEAQKKLQQQAEEARKAREQEQSRLDTLKKQRNAEQKAEARRQTKLKKQHEAEQKAEAAHAARIKQQTEAEQKRLATLKAEREAAAKKQAEEKKRAAEAKKKAEEAARKRKEAAEEAERKRKEAAEHARQAKIAEQKKQAATQLQQELAAEQQARNASLIAQYQTIISQKITRNWVRPPSAQQNIDCTVEVEQIPGGQVVKAQVTACNANDAVRQSIETAVYKASPLPAPPDPSVFSRQLEIHFNPTGQ